MIVTYEVIFIIARTTTIMVDMCPMAIIIETTMVIHVILTYSVMRIDDESTLHRIKALTPSPIRKLYGEDIRREVETLLQMIDVKSEGKKRLC